MASKLLEKVAEQQLVSFLEGNKVLSDHQFGFQHGRSAEDLLSKAVIDWSRSRDAGLTTAVAFIDLSKAFDKVDHQALLVTLQESGLGGVALNWLASYLSNRQQRVCSNAAKCPYQAVE